jgi:hypothetical protein
VCNNDARNRNENCTNQIFIPEMRTSNSQQSDLQGNNFFKICAMGLHIGREIEKKFDESGIKPEEFAKRINTGKRNLYTIFKREDINSGQLKRISEALDFDFFAFYRQQPSQPVKPDKTDTISILVHLDGKRETLERQVSRLRRINEDLS